VRQPKRLRVDVAPGTETGGDCDSPAVGDAVAEICALSDADIPPHAECIGMIWVLCQQFLLFGLIEKNESACFPEKLIIKTNGGIEHCSGDVARIVATGMEMGVAGVAEGQITPALDIIIYWAAIEGFGVDAGVPGIDYKGIATSQFPDPLILGLD
jgi:hypothetical protein